MSNTCVVCNRKAAPPERSKSMFLICEDEIHKYKIYSDSWKILEFYTNGYWYHVESIGNLFLIAKSSNYQKHPNDAGIFDKLFVAKDRSINLLSSNDFDYISSKIDKDLK